MEKSEKEILDFIIAEINKGELIKDIAVQLGTNPNKVNDYLNRLININSSYYNPDLYQELAKKKKENANRGLSERFTPFRNKTIDIAGIVNTILKWHLSLEEASKQFHKSEEEILNYINDYNYNDGKKEKIMKLFERRREYPTLKLFNLPTKVQEEIALMILTYRVHPDDLMILFKTGPDDIALFLENQPVFGYSFYSLKIEASYASSEERKMAFENAKSYWLMRNKLIKRLNEAEKDNVKEYLQEKLKEHRSLIDDTLARESAKKNTRDLTQEEKDAIAQIRVKYGINTTEQRHEYYQVIKLNSNLAFLNRCADIINDYEYDLAKRDSYFAKRLDILKGRTEVLKNKALESSMKR